jgi:uncharacterized protein (UPF0276 family)
MAAPAASPCIAGIGLRHPHYVQVVEERPAVGFVEVHSENFYADGGAALAVLEAAREHYPVSLHGVGLALGSAVGVDAWHLDRLERLVQRTDPVRVSDHACFARAPARPGGPVLHASDLLPIAHNDASLAILADNVSRVQDRLRRPLLVENLSAYLSHRDSTLAEAEFLALLCRRSGCGLLLDVNNLMVNALNDRVPDPLAHGRAFVDALPLGIVGEIHLAGYCDTPDLVIDDHGSLVRPGVWALYEHALQRFGEVPTLIEWDTDVPPLAVLLAEAQQATDRLARLHR